MASSRTGDLTVKQELREFAAIAIPVRQTYLFCTLPYRLDLPPFLARPPQNSLTNLCRMAMMLTDTMVLGHFSSDLLTAASVAGVWVSNPADSKTILLFWIHLTLAWPFLSSPPLHAPATQSSSSYSFPQALR